MLLGASLTLFSAAVEPKTNGPGSDDECTRSSLEAFDSPAADFTYLLQTGTSRVARPSSSLEAKGSSLMQTASQFFPPPNRVQLPVDDLPGSHDVSEHEPLELQSTVDAQDMALSVFMKAAHDRYLNPIKYGYTFNTSGVTSESNIQSSHDIISPLAYVMLLLVVVILSASLYMDTLEHKKHKEDTEEDDSQPVIQTSEHSLLGSSLHRKGSEGTGLARHSRKLPVGTTGLLEDAEMHSHTTKRGAHEGVGKGGSAWETTGYYMLARLPGLHTFGGALLLLVVLPRLHPTCGLHLQIALLLYGLLKFFVTGMWTACGLWKIKNQEQMQSVISGHAADQAGGTSVDGSIDAVANVQSVLHCVVIPCYKEAVSTISATLHTLKQQTVASQIVVVLAMEARDKQAVQTAQLLMDQFQASGLAAIFYTLHDLHESETPGKSSNENWAFRCCKRWLCDATGYPLEQIVFTTCDADTYFHPQHFEYLSYLFLQSDEPHRSLWQGAICAFPNSYDLPALASVRYIMLSLGYLGQLANGVSLCGNFPLGVYSMSAKLAHEVGYWDPTVIPEDWHMFFKVNLESSGGPVRCVPMYTVVGNLGVEGTTYWESMKGCYTQSVRWQWGGISMGYLLMQFFQSNCPVWKRVSLIAGHYEHHFLLPLIWLSAVTLPALYRKNCIYFRFDANFLNASPMNAQGAHPFCDDGGIAIDQLSIILWTFFWLSNWIAVMVLEWWYRSIVKGREHFGRVPQGPPTLGRALTLLLFPVTDLVFHVVPTWHAYLKMFLQTRFEYEVAAKGALSQKQEEVKRVCTSTHRPLHSGRL